MNVAVCDDEKIIRNTIKALVEKRKPDFPIGISVETFATGEELLAAQKEGGSRFDIVFLDIQMEGMNGIETARALRKLDEDIVLIFITAIKEYVFQAFDVAAFHYLLKPIDGQRFMEVFDRAAREVEKHRRRIEERIIVKAGKRSVSLNKKDILYIENKAKKLEIHTTEEVIVIYAAMSEMECQLDTGFYRCHRGYLVNMAHIVKYDKTSITLKCGGCVYLAKEKYSEFVKTYMRYLRNEVYSNV